MNSTLFASVCSLAVGLGLGILLTPSGSSDGEAASERSEIRSAEAASASPAEAGEAPKANAATRELAKEITAADSEFDEVNRFFAEFQNLTPEQIPGLLKEIQRNDGGWAIKRLLAEHWAEMDPEAALRWVARQEEHGLMNYVAGKLARDDPEQAAALARTLSDESMRNAALRAIIYAYDDVDPAAALALNERVFADDPRRRSSQLYNVMRTWAEKDPRAAFAHATSVTHRRDRERLLQAWASAAARAHGRLGVDMIINATELNHREKKSIIDNALTALADDSPLVALDAYRSLPSESMVNRWVLGRIYREWAEDDPWAAIEQAQAQEKSADLDTIYGYVFARWADRDPESAKLAAEQLSTHPRAKVRAVGEVVKEIAKRDFAAATAYLDSLQDPQMRNSVISRIAYQMQRVDPEATFTLLNNSLEGRRRDHMLGRVLGEVVQENPQRALELADTLSGPTRGQALAAMASQWAQFDLPGAFAWVRDMPASRRRTEIYNRIIRKYAENHPKQAQQWLETLDDTALAKEHIHAVVRALAKEDIPRTLGWVDSIEDANQRRSAMSQLMNDWARQDPEGALRHVEELIGEDENAGEYLRNALKNISQHDPSRAAEYVDAYWEDLGDHDRRNTVNNVLQNWFSSDPVRAHEWLATFPTGSTRANAVGRLVRHYWKDDPEYAYGWAQTVQDDSKRYRAVTDSLRYWSRQDPNAAERAVRNAGYGPEEETKYLNIIESGRENPYESDLPIPPLN